jgi:hypothetical protein
LIRRVGNSIKRCRSDKDDRAFDPSALLALFSGSTLFFFKRT